jgi:serine/threonine protein kinase/Tfp pilus assembly protein PilF
MGVVYEAEQVSLGRRVALKVLPYAGALDPRQLLRFQNEARAAACLHHTNIVPVHFVGSERGVHFFAMQFIDGQTLADLVRQLRQPEGTKEGGPSADEGTTAYQPAAGKPAAATEPVGAQLTLSTGGAGRGREYFRRVAELGVQAAEALDHAHQAGIVHRDIKPANLMLDGRSNLWVTDFGLAHIQHSEASLTATGDLVGTLRYMSPEQALAKRVPVDHRTDVYSLGATLYELLTLRPAFDGKDRQELLRQIAFEEPTAPRKLERSIPEELETIVLKAMEKNPADRYATAQELADDLRRFLEHRPVQARRPTLWRRLSKLSRRHRSVMVTAALGLVVALTVLAGSVGWVVRDAEARRAGAAARQAEVERAAEADLDEAGRHLKGERLSETSQALERAEGRLASGGPEHLRERLAQLRRDVAAVARAEKARALASLRSDLEFHPRVADRAYAELFAEYGLNPVTGPPEEAARRIRQSAVRAHLVVALDEWSLVKEQLRPGDGRQLLAVARLADDDPRRQRLRDLLGQPDADALERLAEEKETLGLPPAHLQLLAHLLDSNGRGEAGDRLLRRALQRHPRDFWCNAVLGSRMQGAAQKSPAAAAEAAGYLRVALAVRPQSPQIQNILGILLRYGGKLDEAEDAHRKAIEIDPRHAAAHNNLGNALLHKGQVDEAIACYRKAIELDPKDAIAHSNLGGALRHKGEVEEAIASYQKAIELDPKFAIAHNGLGAMISDEERNYDRAIACFRKAIALDPKLAEAHGALGLVLLRKGRSAEARDATARALELLPDKHPLRAFVSRQLQTCEGFVKLEARLPRLLTGEDKPASAGECLSVVTLCHRKRMHAAAARFSADAFAAAPKLADDLEDAHRYNAACDAALAAAGQGEDAARLDEKERARLRKQALGWLSADLRAWRALLEKEPAKAGPAVAGQLAHWLEDTDFAGVRGGAALAKLPEAERGDWEKLWQGVKALRQRAARPPDKAAVPRP